MIISHNMLAMNASRQYGITTKNKAKSSEKLSSGYRINRAIDDAAGLSISEKMRKQIRGLTQGCKNCEEAINMCNVADGAMAEVDDIIHRMNELCIQSANETNSDADREALDGEIQQLKREIDRIGNTTEYNQIKVLQGVTGTIVNGKKCVSRIETSYRTETVKELVDEEVSLKKSVWGGENAYVKEYFGVEADKEYQYSYYPAIQKDYYTYYYRIDFQNINSKEAWKNMDQATISFGCPLGCAQRAIFIFDNSSDGIYNSNSNVDFKDVLSPSSPIYHVGTKNYTSGLDFISDLQKYLKYNNPSGTYKSGGITYSYSNAIGHQMVCSFSGTKMTVSHTTLTSSAPNMTPDARNMGIFTASSAGWEEYTEIRTIEKEVEVKIPEEKVVWEWVDVDENEEVNDIMIQYGADAGQYHSIRLPHIDIEALDMIEVAGNPIEKAEASINMLGKALEKVNAQRSRMGAYVNELTSCVNNQENIIENTTDAESRIRDMDMAEEMVEYSKQNILEQVGQSMLAQANQSSQGVLSLLQ